MRISRQVTYRLKLTLLTGGQGSVPLENTPFDCFFFASSSSVMACHSASHSAKMCLCFKEDPSVARAPEVGRVGGGRVGVE